MCDNYEKDDVNYLKTGSAHRVTASTIPMFHLSHVDCVWRHNTRLVRTGAELCVLVVLHL